MTFQIVTFCNADYIPVAKNWLIGLEKLGLGANAKVISLDEATRDAFPAERILHRPATATASDLNLLWQHRIVVLQELLTQNISLIHSDADAIWLRNPIPDIESCDADMVFSQGTFWPRDIHALRGLVLCCGFFCLRHSPSTRTFLEAVRARMPEDKDDQIAVNRIISDWIGDWKINAPYHIPFRDTQFVASHDPITASGQDKNGRFFSIAVLPHHAYPRLLDETSDKVVVAHPLSGKTMKEKENILGDLGLWYL